MKPKPFLAGLLSLVVPGLGHIYCGETNKGAVVLVAAIIVGSLNIIFLPVFLASSPNPETGWSYWIPRIGHDVISFWSVVFWIWVVVDAFSLARKA